MVGLLVLLVGVRLVVLGGLVVLPLVVVPAGGLQVVLGVLGDPLEVEQVEAVDLEVVDLVVLAFPLDLVGQGE